MKAKRIVFIFLYFLINVYTIIAQNKEGNIYIKGTVKNFAKQLQVEDMSEIAPLSLPDSDRVFVPDRLGGFSINFKIKGANYFRIGRNILYLSPGDRCFVFIDYDDPGRSTFKGSHYKENVYLRNTPFPKGGSFLKSGENIKHSISGTLKQIFIEAEVRRKELISCSNISEKFRILELARIRADILNSLYKMASYFLYENKIKKDSAEKINALCNEVTSPYIKIYAKNFLKAKLLKLPVYRDIITNIFMETQTVIDTRDTIICRDWLNAINLSYRIDRVIGKDQLVEFKREVNRIITPEFKSALLKKVNKLLEFGDGDKAINFSGIDYNDKSVQLESLKGKIIYIDIWATWCGPCIKELPYLNKLKNYFKNNTDIAFLSLSIDEDKENWIRNLKRRNDLNLQWLISKEKLNPYSVMGIPRVIIINKNFLVESMNGLQPSSENITEYLERLLNK